MSSKETDARILTDKTQVLTEHTVLGTGRADYLLLDQNGRPLAVVEAKRSAIQPYVAKQQALPYAKQIGAPFIFLTNGELIYFWDYTNDDARIVNAFYSRRDLERVVHMRGERKALATLPIPDYYLRQGEQRQVRSYQKEAMQALDHAIELGKRRFLIELPTGTGKTDLITLYLKRLIQAGRAERILFLVDREQLAKQALEAIQDILDQYGSYWLRFLPRHLLHISSVTLLEFYQCNVSHLNPRKCPVRTGVSWSLTNSAHFGPELAGFLCCRLVSETAGSGTY